MKPFLYVANKRGTVCTMDRSLWDNMGSRTKVDYREASEDEARGWCKKVGASYKSEKKKTAKHPPPTASADVEMVRDVLTKDKRE